MEIKIDNSQPWFTQLENSKSGLIEKALTLTEGDKTKAANILGCNVKTINNYIKRKKICSSFQRPKYSLSEEDKNNIKLLFELSYTIKEIAQKTKRSEPTIRRILKNLYDSTTYSYMIKTNKKLKSLRRRGKMNTDQILNDNRTLINEILEKIRNNKLEELSDENIFYAKVLFKNGFITSTGLVTEKGKEALYH